MIFDLVITDFSDTGLAIASFLPTLMSTRTVSYLVALASLNKFLLARLDASTHEFFESYLAE